MSSFRTRLRLKTLKPIKLPAAPSPLMPWMPTPYPMPNSTSTICRRCGHDWSGVQSYYCPTCMGAQCSVVAS